MDDEDRSSNSSNESDRDNDQDEVMEDAEEPDNENDHDNENDNDGEEENNDDEDEDADADASNDAPDATTKVDVNGDTARSPHEPSRQKSATPSPQTLPALRGRPTPSADTINARLYDIVPTMAAPQATSINAMAITPDMRYWMTGGSDGYIRKYDGPGTLNGKLTLTVAQKHPFVDSVTKAGILMSYWENEEPAPPGRGEQEHVLSPVYSLAVHADALWLLSGLESGGINLQSVRYDEGKRITCLQKHTNAVSVLTLAQDEKSVLSGGWDKQIFDWDLNTGQTKRSFDGNGGQVSALELRPASGDPVPAMADEPIFAPSNTISTNNSAPPVNGSATNGFSSGNLGSFDNQSSFATGANGAVGDGTQDSPANESLFGGGSDAGSLFGETTGEQPFGQDDDEFATGMDMMPTHEGGMDHSADMAMAGIESTEPGKDIEKEPAPAVQPIGDEKPVIESQTESTQQTTASDGQDENQSMEPAYADAQLKREFEEQNSMMSSQNANGVPSTTQQPNTLSPTLLSSAPAQAFDPTQVSDTTFLSAAMDGTIRIWDRRVPNPVARIGNRPGVPPWCMSACWSPDGNMIYAGRRNGTVEEFDVRKARRGWEPERTLKFPTGSGPISALRPMVNGRHLVW